jgi:hypothetical protein
MSESQVMYIEMSDERKAQWKRVSTEIIDLLKREFQTPVEGAALLKFILESFQNVYGIQDSFTMKERIQ